MIADGAAHGFVKNALMAAYMQRKICGESGEIFGEGESKSMNRAPLPGRQLIDSFIDEAGCPLPCESSEKRQVLLAPHVASGKIGL